MTCSSIQYDQNFLHESIMKGGWENFFDFIQFENATKDLEVGCNSFAQRGKENVDWVINQTILFLQFQKRRVETEQITASTLKNFVKSLKVFCESADIDIPWKKITRGLPKGKQSANDRAPTIQDIRKLIEYPDRRIKPIVYTWFLQVSVLVLGIFCGGNT